MNDRYLLKYKIEIEQNKDGFTKEEIIKDGQDFGGCDALMLVSILRDNKEPHNGAKSMVFVTRDGSKDREEEIPNTEVFQIMHHLARYSMDQVDLPQWQRDIAKETHEKIKETVLSKREDKK